MKNVILARLAGAGAAALLAGSVAVPGVAMAAGSGLPPLDPAVLSAVIGGLPDADVTAALVRIDGSAGSWSGVDGLADLARQTPVAADDRYRIGSVSKVFTAVVVLQLVAEHRIDLGKSIQHYLPGVLPASYPPITVGQLLNHTSGLPNGGDGTIHDDDPVWFVAHRHDSWTPRQIVAMATTNPMNFVPGTSQQYNGLNYYLAGMLVETVTGHSFAREVNDRILRPLHLDATSVPDRQDDHISGPHLHGYLPVPSDGGSTLVDVSDQSPYPWAEGGMISSAPDLEHFVRALFQGKLLAPAQLRLMFTLPDVPYIGTDNCVAGLNPGRACFSMGLTTLALPNGVTVWGKTGSRPGYTDGVFATRDLARIGTYAFTPTSGDNQQFIVGIAAAAFDPDLL